jgi:hypothetical protein
MGAVKRRLHDTHILRRTLTGSLGCKSPGGRVLTYLTVLRADTMLLSCCLGDLLGDGVCSPIATLSSPRDRRSISAPKWWSAVMVEGVGSGMLESGSQRSCVSRVVSSVSVEPAECARWLRCCGVEHDAPAVGLPVVVDGSSSRRHVHLRSMPAHRNTSHGCLHTDHPVTGPDTRPRQCRSLVNALV